MALKAAGITDITAVDLFDIRLNKALEVGATRVINTKDKDTAAEVLKYYDNIGPDYVLKQREAAIRRKPPYISAKRRNHHAGRQCGGRNLPESSENVR